MSSEANAAVQSGEFPGDHLAFPTTLLDVLRSQTAVDCDTLDVDIAGTLGPFVDCTSNQVIACFELQNSRNEQLLKKSAALAHKLKDDFKDVPLEELAVEITMLSLSLQMAPHITGFIHIQTNPFHAYSIPDTVENAKRIVSLCRHIAPGFETSRLCIKVPSSWEGLQACRILEATGIRTLATTLFTMEQAALAGDMGCRYIAPYVNELKVHFDKGYRGAPPLLELCALAQRYYEEHYYMTEVLPASLTSMEEIMALAGAHHITIAPPLLRELSSTEVSAYDSSIPNVFEAVQAQHEQPPELMSFSDDEAGFRTAFKRNDNGKNEAKMTQAIEIFREMQQKLETMMKDSLAEGNENVLG